MIRNRQTFSKDASQRAKKNGMISVGTQGNYYSDGNNSCNLAHCNGFGTNDDDDSEPLLNDTVKYRNNRSMDGSGEKIPGFQGDKRFCFFDSSEADVVIDTDSHMTWIADEAVKMRHATTDNGPDYIPPMSVISAFQEIVQKYPDQNALAFRPDIKSDWEFLTYEDYYDLVCRAAKAFIKLGLKMYHGVGIIGFNSVEWFVANLGCIFAGGLATGIYTTNSPATCQYVAKSARCNVIIVENDSQLQKILSVRNQLPLLCAIVQYRGHLTGNYPDVYTWSDFISLGSDVSDAQLQDRISSQATNKCCTLIYTSGTTGDPKGVMLSHDNLIWTARSSTLQARLDMCTEVLVSFLPLSHIAAQILDIYIPMLVAGTVYFAQPDVLKGSLVDTLKAARPTLFLGVPRVWEKIQEKMVDASKNQWWFQKYIARWAKSIGLAGNLALMNGGPVPYGWTVANLLVFQKVRNALGLDRCKMCMTAAAPIMKDTLDFFMSLNLPIMQIYGMSESSGPHTVSFPWRYRTVSAGVNLNSSQTKFTNPDEHGHGEICMYGRNVFMGYVNMAEKTWEAFDENNWLKSGDVGCRDEDDYIFVTGRIKEILITAGGENIAPVLIEDTIKVEMSCVSNAMLIGDGRKFVSVLLTLKTDNDPSSVVSSDQLSRASIDWFARHNVYDVRTVSQVISNPPNKKVLAAIQSGINRVNEKAISHAQFIQKWSVLPNDFSIPGGELGPTLKLKRNVVLEKYKQTIDALYIDLKH